MEENAVKVNLAVVSDRQSFDPMLSAESDARGTEYVRWGTGNAFPRYLLDTYNNCVTLQSIINGSVNYTMGNGVVDNIHSPWLMKENEYGETIEDVVAKCVYDRWIFGGFAIQVKYNSFGHIVSIAWVDFSKLRTDKSGEWIYVMDSRNLMYGGNRCRKIAAFNPEDHNRNSVRILYFKGLKTRDTYPKPDYYAALPACQTQIQVQKFHLAELYNNFMPSMVIKLKGWSRDDDTVNGFARLLEKQFVGEGNQGRFMIVPFDETMDVALERLATDDFDKRYEALYKSSIEDIFNSLSAPPTIFGMLMPTGFAKQEYGDAFRLYNKTMVMPKQLEMTRVFNRLFGAENGVDAVSFIPFSIGVDAGGGVANEGVDGASVKTVDNGNAE